MKKILAIALALCLTLSLTVCAIADYSPVVDRSPDLNPGGSGGIVEGGANTSKLSYGAVNEDGRPASVDLSNADVSVQADELGALVGSDNVGMVLKVVPVAGCNGKGTIDAYAGNLDTSASYDVWQDDEWVKVEGATVRFNGDRVLITMDLSSLSQYPYIALVKSDAVGVTVPSDTTTNDADDEGGDDANVGDDNAEPAPEKNPHTGLALAVVPMAVAAAAIVVSKRR